MLNRTNACVVCFLSAWLAVSVAGAQEPKPAAKPETGEKLVETKHAIALPTGKLEYTATAGTLPLKDEGGKTIANLFFVAYVKAGPGEPGKRPVTFAFNGGPGSSAVWLHLGCFGPRRVAVGDVGEPSSPPYHLVDNESTLLDVADLVFIDPVDTGYSRAAPGQDAKRFHGVEEDVHSVGEFIRAYVTRFNRWDSPKFLAGESYGTTRAAALAGYLQDHVGMNLNGVILLSSILNFGTLGSDEGNDLPFILYLPSLTATAWYHKKLPPDLQEAGLPKALEEAERFALGEYTVALMKGTRLPPDEQKAVAQKLARYTGLSEDYVLRSNLRIESTRFRKELLRHERQIVGRFDSRFTGTDLDAVGDRPEYDPSYAQVQAPYTATFNQYVRNELKYETDLSYEVLTGKVQPWDFGSARNRYLNVADTLRQALTKNRGLRVYVGSGYYDLATAYCATEYTFSHMGLNGNQSDRVTMGYYRAGHMMYVHKPSLQQLRKELGAFIEAAVQP